jgi:lysophospholipase L1-like esterase
MRVAVGSLPWVLHLRPNANFAAMHGPTVAPVRILLSFALLLFISTPVEAARIVVLGDSWGVPAAPALQAVLVAESLPDTVANHAVGGDTAASLSSPSGLLRVTDALAANPEADLVHLSIGGNDFLGSWTAALTPEQEADLFGPIAEDIDTILDHILTTRPGVRIFVSSYDYPRPIPSGTPAQVNAAAHTLTALIEDLAAAKGIGVTAGNYLGLMQVVYGFDGVQHTAFDPAFAIPAGDPSLPDPTLPSPSAAYADAIHLTSTGYAILAEEQFATFYGPLLVPDWPCPSLPRLGCHEAAQASLQVSEKKVGKEQLKLQWKKLATATTQGEFGDPVSGSEAAATCLYGDAGALIQQFEVDRAGQTCAGNPCWKAKGTAGYSCKDKESSADGIGQLSFGAGDAGKGKAAAKGRNNAGKGQTALPTGLVAQLSDLSAPTIQIVTEAGFCATATMTEVKINDGTQYKAQKK